MYLAHESDIDMSNLDITSSEEDIQLAGPSSRHTQAMRTGDLYLSALSPYIFVYR